MRPVEQDRVISVVVSRRCMECDTGLQTNRISSHIRWLKKILLLLQIHHHLRLKDRENVQKKITQIPFGVGTLTFDTEV